jgi:hypothetical protein
VKEVTENEGGGRLGSVAEASRCELLSNQALLVNFSISPNSAIEKQGGTYTRARAALRSQPKTARAPVVRQRFLAGGPVGRRERGTLLERLFLGWLPLFAPKGLSTLSWAMVPQD